MNVQRQLMIPFSLLSFSFSLLDKQTTYSLL